MIISSQDSEARMTYIKFTFETENNAHGFIARGFVQLWEYQLVSCYHLSEARLFIEIHTKKIWGGDAE